MEKKIKNLLAARRRIFARLAPVARSLLMLRGGGGRNNGIAFGGGGFAVSRRKGRGGDVSFRKKRRDISRRAMIARADSFAVKDFFAAPPRREAVVAFVVAAVSVYLMFVNLDYVTLWHDEGANAIMSASLARDGTLSAWDGRNLYFGIRGGEEYFGITEDLNFAYPPWSGVPSALGILFFGGGEFALRFPHAFLGALSLPVLYFLLRLNFPARPRLRLLAFAMFALSPIVILYMRQGRYYPDAVLFTLLAFYCYQRFWRDGGVPWLCGLSFFTVLNFLNHFGGGFSAAAATAAWHVIYFRRETSPRQWLQFAAAGFAAAAACGGYLFAAKIVGGEISLEYDAGFYEFSWAKRHAYLMFYYFRDLIRTGWLPLWVALWWIWFAARGFSPPPPP